VHGTQERLAQLQTEVHHGLWSSSQSSCADEEPRLTQASLWSHEVFWHWNAHLEAHWCQEAACMFTSSGQLGGELTSSGQLGVLHVTSIELSPRVTHKKS